MGTRPAVPAGYSAEVLEHSRNPRNAGSLDGSDPQVGTGQAGLPEAGDMVRFQVKVGGEGIIQEARFKAFGCGSSIASSSLMTEWVAGKSIEEALKIKNTDLAEALDLPPAKVHCSVLVEEALRAAIEDYLGKQADGIAPKPGDS